MRRAFLTHTATATAAVVAPRVRAQATAFPDRPVRIIVAFAPGGSVDPVIRALQPKLSELLGQPVVIENRPGASTSLACIAVTKSPADGHTLLFTAGGGHVVHTIDRPQFPYDPLKDFTPVAGVSRSSWAFVVYPGLPVKSISEYVAYGRANPGKISFFSSGTGLLNHLAIERFHAAAGIKAVHVPYKNTSNAVLDLAAGRIHAAFSTRSTLQPQVDAGKMRALAYSGALPGEVPPHLTFASAGLPEIDDTDTINVLLGPANLPPAVLSRWSGAVEKALALPEIQAAVKALSQAPYYQSPKDLGVRLHAEQDKYRRIIKTLGIKMNET